MINIWQLKHYKINYRKEGDKCLSLNRPKLYVAGIHLFLSFSRKRDHRTRIYVYNKRIKLKKIKKNYIL